MNSPQNVYLPLGKLRTEFTSPVVKSTSPGLRHHFLFILDSYCWNQVKLQSCQPVWFVSSLYLFLPHYYNHHHDFIRLTQMMQNIHWFSHLRIIQQDFHFITYFKTNTCCLTNSLTRCCYYSCWLLSCHLSIGTKAKIYKLALMCSYVRHWHHGWGGMWLIGQHLCQPCSLEVQMFNL